jgi:hypothetical protein
MNEMEIESAIQRAGKTAPRITPSHIDSLIFSRHFFTASQGVEGSFGGAASLGTLIADGEEERVPDALGLLTFCVLTLRNGFTVTGESACASPENFDPGIGRDIAFKNAREKIWLLEGYLLRDRLSNSADLA